MTTSLRACLLVAVVFVAGCRSTATRMPLPGETVNGLKLDLLSADEYCPDLRPLALACEGYKIGHGGHPRQLRQFCQSYGWGQPRDQSRHGPLEQADATTMKTQPEERFFIADRDSYPLVCEKPKAGVNWVVAFSLSKPDEAPRHLQNMTGSSDIISWPHPERLAKFVLRWRNQGTQVLTLRRGYWQNLHGRVFVRTSGGRDLALSSRGETQGETAASDLIHLAPGETYEEPCDLSHWIILPTEKDEGTACVEFVQRTNRGSRLWTGRILSNEIEVYINNGVLPVLIDATAEFKRVAEATCINNKRLIDHAKYVLMIKYGWLKGRVIGDTPEAIWEYLDPYIDGRRRVFCPELPQEHYNYNPLGVPVTCPFHDDKTDPVKTGGAQPAQRDVGTGEH